MPGFDGSGPRATRQMAGRGVGRCRFGPAHPDILLSPGQAPEGAALTGENPEVSLHQAPLYGAGHGGIPYGCGNGRVFGGGRGCRRNKSL